ncbi:MAG TPA: NAD(P)/FAD-dependent oxidoreductase [Leptospiraceae bacterium]|nr:NAD(P)/FAD-dependent oxidoreductase [Leptospiraceae bacterium]
MDEKKIGLRIGIIGAGPSGLTLALALCRRENLHITLFEKGPDHRDAPSYNPLRSYTIDITGHGARAVKYLNLNERFSRDLIRFKGIRLPIFRPMIEETYNGEGWTGSRGDIAKAILEELTEQNVSRKNTVIRFGTEAKIADLKKGIISFDEGRQTETFDLIVACDGAGSPARNLIRESDPDFQVAGKDNDNYAMMLPFDRNTEELDSRYLYIFGLPPFLAVAGAINGKNGPSDPLWVCQIGYFGSRKFSSVDEAEDFLRKQYPGRKNNSVLHYAGRKAIEDFAKQENISTGRAKICSAFHSERIVLLGDAAAPFPPVGQGVNAAMEMAVVLDGCLGEQLKKTGMNTEDIVSESIKNFTKKWKPEADAISKISFHGLDLRRFHPVWFGRVKTVGMVILHKIFHRDPMTNAKREDMKYSEALAYQKKTDLILFGVLILAVCTAVYGFIR